MVYFTIFIVYRDSVFVWIFFRIFCSCCCYRFCFCVFVLHEIFPWKLRRCFLLLSLIDFFSFIRWVCRCIWFCLFLHLFRAIYINAVRYIYYADWLTDANKRDEREIMNEKFTNKSRFRQRMANSNVTRVIWPVCRRLIQIRPSQLLTFLWRRFENNIDRRSKSPSDMLSSE